MNFQFKNWNCEPSITANNWFPLDALENYSDLASQNSKNLEALEAQRRNISQKHIKDENTIQNITKTMKLSYRTSIWIVIILIIIQSLFKRNVVSQCHQILSLFWIIRSAVLIVKCIDCPVTQFVSRTLIALIQNYRTTKNTFMHSNGLQRFSTNYVINALF